MARLPPLWQQNNAYRAQEDRRLIGTAWPAGAVLGMAPTVVTGTMGISVAQGTAAVADWRVPGAGYLCPSDAPETVTLAPADPQDRIDLVVVEPRDSQFGGSDNDWIFRPITGVPAANPVVPAVPAGTTVIAQQRVIGGAAFIVAGNLVDRRGPLLAPAAEPPTTSPSTVARPDTTGDIWVARASANGGAWRRARDVLRAKHSRTIAWNTSGGAAFAFNNPVSDAYGLYTTTGGLTAPVAGLWRVQAVIGATLPFPGPTAGQGAYLAASIRTGAGGVLAQVLNIAGGAGICQMQVACEEWLPVGGQLVPWQTASGAYTGDTGGHIHLSIAYLGTG